MVDLDVCKPCNYTFGRCNEDGDGDGDGDVVDNNINEVVGKKRVKTERREPHRCPWEGCNQQFDQQWSFTRHMRMHEGVKPHQCGFCDMSFVQKCSLDRHLATHSDRRPWKCPFCNETFKLKEYLKEHKKKLHRDILADLDTFKLNNPPLLPEDHEVETLSKIQDLQNKLRDTTAHLATLANRLRTFGIHVEPNILLVINQ